ncbi:DUF3265 domain-containing protein [Vibrio metschnikovii]|nr:DUF3265 domain-containing protein [Vibrio metschnikovii]EKO3570351.1 DUF3265 domain-containing protein [Vibrio metschnikovii]EKO3577092.1 DUF3265 domain-containing protein [Vibrio metschnikovii]EKO3587350.1 DUF3265 domain-containing protein [Vibrio metschnikovii]EKO3597749.1 DUF3265 domain-containing protein [Vibrio metschnikovii]
MTRRLSGIHAAWHFWFAVSFGGESGLRKLGLGGIHPLTRRYVLLSLSKINSKILMGKFRLI